MLLSKDIGKKTKLRWNSSADDDGSGEQTQNSLIAEPVMTKIFNSATFVKSQVRGVPLPDCPQVHHFFVVIDDATLQVLSVPLPRLRSGKGLSLALRWPSNDDPLVVEEFAASPFIHVLKVRLFRRS